MAGTEQDPGKWHTLTDLQVLALLAAAPEQSIMEGRIVREERSHWLYFLHESVAPGRPPQASMMPTACTTLARVLGLPPAPHDGAALRMRVEWDTTSLGTAPGVRMGAPITATFDLNSKGAPPPHFGTSTAGTEPDPGAREDGEG